MIGSQTFRSKNPANIIFVLCEARCGSTYLISLLDSVPGVKLAGELLNSKSRTASPPSSLPYVTLQYIQDSLRPLASHITGAKFFFGTLEDYGVSFRDLRRGFPRAKYIILYRKSLGEQYLSLLLAYATDSWLFNQKPKILHKKLPINRDIFRQYCLKAKERYRKALGHGLKGSAKLLLAYEDLVKDPQKVFDSMIAPLIGISPHKVRSKMEKQGTRPLEDMIENYDSVKDLLNSEIAHQEYLP